MQLVRSLILLAFGVALCGEAEVVEKKPHHRHHHKRHSHHAKGHLADVNHSSVAAKITQLASSADSKVNTGNSEQASEESIVSKMRQIEGELAKKESTYENVDVRGKIKVNGPLPVDFSERFRQAAAKAVPCDPAEVQVVESYPVDKAGNLVEIIFEAPTDVVHAIEDQSANPGSALTNSPLKQFLVQRQGPYKPGAVPTIGTAPELAIEAAGGTPTTALISSKSTLATAASADSASGVMALPATDSIDIDTAMPYGELEPFGREDTAQELTESSIKESDEMVDQLERAEVAEEKRAVFRALTRLRGAAITSFDGIARSQTGNIDEYNKVHKWRNTHPLRHLADEESDVSKWAFPDDADF